ncbi:MAG: right-handed parallel beta-helix repeat-containing protein [Terriglobia bacterium]
MNSRRKTANLLIITMALALLASTATARTFYVNSQTGNDTNAGSRTAPWETIQKAADSMWPGDTAMIAAGDYPERVQITRSGAAGYPIAYQASGKVVMNGFTINASYVWVIGFEITGHIRRPRDNTGIYIQGGHDEILGNYVHDVCSGGIVLSGGGNPDSPLTNHNLVKGNRVVHASGPGIAVAGRFNLIERNDISHTVQYPPGCPASEGADADGIDPFFGTGNVIRKNHIHDILSSDPGNLDPHIDCFETWGPARDITIEQNVCDVNESRFLPVQGAQIENSSAPVSHITFRNNVFMNIRMGVHVEQIGHTPMPSILVLNNTFYRITFYGVLAEGCPGVVIENNVFYDVGSHRYSYLGLGPGSLVSNVGSYMGPKACPEAGLVVGYNAQSMSDGRPPGRLGSRAPYSHDLWMINPGFVNAGAKDFRLLPNSPLVGAGVVLKDVPTDIRSIKRAQSRGYDIGAYEYKR